MHKKHKQQYSLFITTKYFDITVPSLVNTSTKKANSKIPTNCTALNIKFQRHYLGNFGDDA